MRSEVDSILQRNGCRYFDLPLSARLLLVADGTVTELLEALMNEPITLGLKNQINGDTDAYSAKLNIAENTPCLYRQITLRGEISKTDWLYAESIVLYKSFSSRAQTMLKRDNVPIGVILNIESKDNHREIVDCGYRRNNDAAKHLGLQRDYKFLYRTYKVMIESKPLMVITEWFPIDRISKSLEKSV